MLFRAPAARTVAYDRRGADRDLSRGRCIVRQARSKAGRHHEPKGIRHVHFPPTRVNADESRALGSGTPAPSARVDGKVTSSPTAFRSRPVLRGRYFLRPRKGSCFIKFACYAEAAESPAISPFAE